jgi:hypothetical protein
MVVVDVSQIDNDESMTLNILSHVSARPKIGHSVFVVLYTKDQQPIVLAFVGFESAQSGLVREIGSKFKVTNYSRNWTTKDNRCRMNQTIPSCN